MLENIVNGKKQKPLNILVYGLPGIGKSTFAASAPSPIFLGAEENDELSVDRFPRAQKWKEVIDQVSALQNEDHEYKTVVIDTLDSIELLLHENILANDKADVMARACGGFGAGYVKASSEFVTLRRMLSDLREKKGMNVILLAHSQKMKFTDPLQNIEYDTYELKLDRRAAPIFKDWCSAVLFANWVVFKTKNDTGKEYAVGAGQRVLLTESRPGHDGKNRFNLPYEIDFNWETFIGHVREFYK